MADDLKSLRDSLKIIKDKEIRLEADLAIRDDSKNEVAIIKAALALFEISKALRLIKSVSKPESKTRGRILKLNQKIQQHTHKLKEYEGELEEAIKAGGSMLSKYQKALEQVTEAHELFAAFYAINKTKFDSVSLEDIFSTSVEAIEYAGSTKK
jgi:hypothetical protein